MENKNSIEHLLMQIGELVELIQNHKGPLAQNITPKMLAQINHLEEAMGILTNLQQTAFQIAGVDTESLKKMSVDSPSLANRDKQLIKRADHIIQDATLIQLALSKSRERGRKSKRLATSSQTTKSGKQTIKERRKLFKPLGGDKTWIPL